MRSGFWEDIWCRDSPLHIEFGAIYNLSMNKFEKIKEFYDLKGGVGLFPRLSRILSIGSWIS